MQWLCVKVWRPKYQKYFIKLLEITISDGKNGIIGKPSDLPSFVILNHSQNSIHYQKILMYRTENGHILEVLKDIKLKFYTW